MVGSRKRGKGGRLPARRGRRSTTFPLLANNTNLRRWELTKPMANKLLRLPVPKPLQQLPTQLDRRRSESWSVNHGHAVSEEEAESVGAVITRTICRNRDERRRLQSYRFSSDNHRRRPSLRPPCYVRVRRADNREGRKGRARGSIPDTQDLLLGFQGGSSMYRKL